MVGVTLRSRAVTFALSAGAVAFFLALLVTTTSPFGVGDVVRALIPAVVCGYFSWAAAQRTVAATADAIDRAVDRLADAAGGELHAQVPAEIRDTVPRLADAMDRLFEQLSSSLEDIQTLALFDTVTGLANRAHFRTGAERLLCDHPIGTAALMFIDLDNFKAVNDLRGHHAGDLLLAMVANRLRGVGDSVVRDGDIMPPLVGRLAGDEFTMFFPALPEAETSAWIAQRVLSALAEPFALPDGDATIGASIGIATRPEHGCSLHELMRCADAAMYRAKANGRARYEYYTDSLATEMADRAQLDQDLRAAIERDEFTLVFQPQVSVRDGRVVAAEALLRWNHPEHGLRLPGSFIARAEESGVMVEIGDWVVERIARTIADWSQAGAPGRLAINVSPRQIDHADFFHRLRAALRVAGAPAGLLELEITETLAMHARADVLAAIAALRDDGATIALDDFGTGYSNLSRLRGLPVDRIKIDRMLVAPIVEDVSARSVVQALVGLIHGLGCEAVAEGVETRAQIEMLRVIGCDAMQGYAVAAPMDEAAFLTWRRVRRRLRRRA